MEKHEKNPVNLFGNEFVQNVIEFNDGLLGDYMLDDYKLGALDVEVPLNDDLSFFGDYITLRVSFDAEFNNEKQDKWQTANQKGFMHAFQCAVEKFDVEKEIPYVQELYKLRYEENVQFEQDLGDALDELSVDNARYVAKIMKQCAQEFFDACNNSYLEMGLSDLNKKAGKSEMERD